jgi:hypothetical protein
MESSKYVVVGEMKRRPFVIILGLRKGYGRTAQTYDAADAIDELERWTVARAQASQAYLPGRIRQITYLLGHGSGETGSADTEPGIEFVGSVSSYLADWSDAAVKELLNDLARCLALRLSQLRVELEYCDEAWAIQLEC